MTPRKQQVDLDKLRMSESEFDRIMRGALQVKPEAVTSKKAKKAAKKKRAKK